MENTQTAVELLAILIYSDCQFGGTLDNRISIDKNYLEEIIEQSKEMEKDQIMRAYMSGEVGEIFELKNTLTAKQYYENNYGK